MLTRNSTLILACLLTCTSGWAQFTLSIEITHFRNDNGHVLLMLYDENQVEVKSLKAVIQQAKSIFLINDLKPAKYAFKYFHDENDNLAIETNLLGIPQEGFGFSNNAKGIFGPPAFRKWIFELAADRKIVCSPEYL